MYDRKPSKVMSYKSTNQTPPINSASSCTEPFFKNFTNCLNSFAFVECNWPHLLHVVVSFLSWGWMAYQRYIRPALCHTTRFWSFCCIPGSWFSQNFQNTIQRHIYTFRTLHNKASTLLYQWVLVHTSSYQEYTANGFFRTWYSWICFNITPIRLYLEAMKDYS